MTLTLSLTLTCDLCSRDTIIVPALGCTSTIAVIASRRPFRHSDITPLKVDGLVDGGWVTRTRKRKMVDLCGECAGKGKEKRSKSKVKTGAAEEVVKAIGTL